MGVLNAGLAYALLVLHLFLFLLLSQVYGINSIKDTTTTINSIASASASARISSSSSRGDLEGLEREDFLAWLDRVASAKSPQQSLIYRSPSNATNPETRAAAAAVSSQRVIIVDKNGRGQFASVQAAVDAIPKHNTERIVIRIHAGVYSEKVKVPKTKPYVTFQGDGMGVTKITWHDNAQTAGTTLRSASVTVMSPFFIAQDITFENSSPYAKPGDVGKQAVAFQISGEKSAMYRCGFLGAQDTLYDHYGRHYFKDCYIQGSIDFIFGDGLSLYEGCQLKVISTPLGSLTAQKRKTASDNSGFSFVNCRVQGSSGAVYLGRAWGPYSRVVFINTWLDNMVISRGWYDWGIQSRQSTVFYGEYRCSGPGANRNGRVGWSMELTPAQALAFQSIGFIDGQTWL